MIVVNLIPTERRLRRRRRARLRGWAAIVAVYAVFLTVSFIASRVAGSGGDDDVARQLSQVKTRATSSEVTMTALRSDIDEAQARLAANREVGDQPDWSVVLALLARATGDDVVLSRCRLSTTVPPRPQPASARPGSRKVGTPPDQPVHVPATTIEISGLARSQRDVTNFVLRMEEIPLFSEIRLNDTRREPFLTGSVIAFRAEFEISPVRGTDR